MDEVLMAITEIIDALERGETGREIDCAVGMLFGPTVAGAYGRIRIDCGRVSTSLDAVVALLERVFAGQALSWSVRDTIGGASASILLVPENETTEPREVLGYTLAPTPASALCAAILKAHMAKETT